MDERITAAEEQLDQAQTTIERIDALNALAWALTRTDVERAQKLTAEAESLSRSGEFADAPYQKGIAGTLRTRSRLSSFSSKYEESLAQGLKAINILLAIDDKEYLPYIYNTVASCYRNLGNRSEALEYQFKQMKVSEQIGDRHGLAVSTVGIGISYNDMGDFERTLEYFQKGLEIFRELGNKYWIALSLNNISYAWFQKGDYEEALKFGFECLEFARTHNNRRMETSVCNTIGEIYVKSGDTEQAKKYIEQGLTLARELNYPDYQMDSHKLMGEIYHQHEIYDAAIPQFEAALEIATEANHKQFMYDCNLHLSQAHEILGNYQKSLYHHKQYHEIRQSVFNEESRQQLQNLEVLYRTDTAKKEAEYYASLYSSEQDKRQLAEVLNQVGQTLTGTLELSAVLNQMLDQLHALVWYDRGALLLLKDDGLEFVAVSGYQTETSPLQYQVPIDADDELDVFVRIYHSKKPLVIDDVPNYPGWTKVADIPVPSAWLGVPLLRHGEVVGMLSLARESEGAYTDDDQTLATTFAAQAAIALENAKLYNQVKQFNEQLEQKVAERTEELQEAYAQLTRLDQAKSDFIAITAHELRTPITVLKGYGQLLGTDATIRNNPYHVNLVAGITTGANRLLDIVNTMLMMIKLDNNTFEIHTEALMITDIISAIILVLEDQLQQQRDLEIILDDSLNQLPQVEGDKDALLTAFSHLIYNAIKYTPDGGSIRIHGRSWNAAPAFPPNLPDKGVEIIISDTGIGIDPNVQELIFTKFYQTGEVATHSSSKIQFKGGGPGLGLTIARGIITTHDGLIWAESPGYDETNTPGSNFHIVLPQHTPFSMPDSTP
ncbi:MAG TPA: tetratricopeptide repeat protein [Anaerolineae bacterium]|nr:tetratricopeptide repeat protein [Anaerolineae bacterium]